MEIYRNLNWARKTRRSPKEQLNLFNFNLSDQEDDIFYQNLNEIDSIFVNDGSNLKASKNYDLPNEEDIDDDVIIDPRTNKPVEQILYDHTLHNVTGNRVEIKYFDKFPRNSTISKKNHQICIRAISLLRSNKHDITESDKEVIQIYQHLETNRLEEKKQFHLFVQNHFNAYLVHRFSRVDGLFKDFLLKYEQYKIGEWIKFCGHKSFVLQTSIPNQAATINDTVEIKFIKIIHKTGIVPFKLKANKSNAINCAKNSKFSLMYIDPNSIKFQPIERDPNVARLISEIDETVDFVVHFSSLVYLMDNSLKSWNIQVKIEETENGSCIFIGKCLPRADLNSVDMIKKGFKFALSYSILNFYNKASWNLDEDRICGTEMKLDYSSSPPWKPLMFKDYLEKLKFPASVLKPNQIYSLFNLSDEKIKFNSNLLIRSKYDAREHFETTHNIINLSKKVEFQSEFGAEIMTKTELIKEWLKQCINVDTITNRIRIDSETGTILSQKYLTLAQIENDLKRLHNLDPKMLLNNLIAKLDLIRKQFPSGEYLLQFNTDLFPHVKVYKLHETVGHVADNNLKLFKLNEYLARRDLYNLDNTFVQYPNPNQIDDMEITLVHRHSGNIPCSFLYADKGNQKASNSKKTSKKSKPILDEKKQFNERRQEKKKRQEMHTNARKNRIKKLKRQIQLQNKAEMARLAKETVEREAREQRQFEYEYNIHGMFDEHGNVRVSSAPIAAPTSLKIINDSNPKQLPKLNAKPKSTPPPLPPVNQELNKTNYSILTIPSSSSSSFAAVSSDESDNDLKIEKMKNFCSKSNLNTINDKTGKQTSGKSVLGSLRKSMRTQTVNKRRYF